MTSAVLWDALQFAILVALMIIMFALNAELNRAHTTIDDLRWKVSMLEGRLRRKENSNAN